MDDIVIRQATSADVEAIGQLWEKLVEYHRIVDSRLPVASENGDKLYARRILDRLDDTHTRILVAECDDQIIGFTLGVVVDLVPEMFQQEIGGFLADIFVEDAYRRQGVGRSLVDTLMTWFKSRGVTYMELYVATQNDSGRVFWQELGGRDIMTRVRLSLKD